MCPLSCGQVHHVPREAAVRLPGQPEERKDLSVVTREAYQRALLIFAFSLVARLLTACRLAGIRLACQVGVLQTWRQLRRETWRKACALGLSTTYASLFLLASLCFATGFFHLDVSHDPHHHQATPDANHTSALLDICDFVLQTLMTTELQMVQFPSSVLPPVDVFALASILLTYSNPAAYHTIRAPPASHA